MLYYSSLKQLDKWDYNPMIQLDEHEAILFLDFHPGTFLNVATSFILNNVER